MKFSIIIISIFFFISCNEKEIQKNKQTIEELELHIQSLESTIKDYKSLNTEKVNKEDSFMIKDIIFKNDKKAYARFYSSGDFFYNQERYLFLVLNMFLLNKDKSYSYDVYQTLSSIYYYDLTHELKNSKLYYFTLYFYTFSVFEGYVQREENALKSGLNPNNIKSPKYYLSKAYE